MADKAKVVTGVRGELLIGKPRDTGAYLEVNQEVGQRSVLIVTGEADYGGVFPAGIIFYMERKNAWSTSRRIACLNSYRKFSLSGHEMDGCVVLKHF